MPLHSRMQPSRCPFVSVLVACARAGASGKQQKIRRPFDITLVISVEQAEQQRLKREAESMAAQTPEAAAEVLPTPQSLPAAPEPPLALAHQQRSQSHQLLVAWEADPAGTCLPGNARAQQQGLQTLDVGCRHTGEGGAAVAGAAGRGEADEPDDAVRQVRSRARCAGAEGLWMWVLYCTR